MFKELKKLRRLELQSRVYDKFLEELTMYHIAQDRLRELEKGSYYQWCKKFPPAWDKRPWRLDNYKREVMDLANLSYERWSDIHCFCRFY